MSAILKTLLKKYDAPARDTTIEYISGSYSNIDIYGVDLLIDNNPFLNIEVQTLSTKSFIDRFRILTIFKRKDRYNSRTIYITYNYNYTKCFCFCRCMLDPEKMDSINAQYSIYKEDKVYYLFKNEVLYIDDINENSFNLQVLNKFYNEKNDIV